MASRRTRASPEMCAQRGRRRSLDHRPRKTETQPASRAGWSLCSVCIWPGSDTSSVGIFSIFLKEIRGSKLRKIVQFLLCTMNGDDKAASGTEGVVMMDSRSEDQQSRRFRNLYGHIVPRPSAIRRAEKRLRYI